MIIVAFKKNCVISENLNIIFSHIIKFDLGSKEKKNFIEIRKNKRFEKLYNIIQMKIKLAHLRAIVCSKILH